MAVHRRALFQPARRDRGPTDAREWIEGMGSMR
jgi:hypothetical protein